MTPHDWEQLSAWQDGTLEASTRQAFEQRFASEPELARAVERLRALERLARTIEPAPVDVAAWSKVLLPGKSAVGAGVAIVVATVVGSAAIGLALSRPSRVGSDSVASEPRASFIDRRAGGGVVDAGAVRPMGGASAHASGDAGELTVISEPVVLAVGERWLLRGRWALEQACDAVKIDSFGEDMRHLTGRAEGRCAVRAVEDGGVRRLEVDVVSLASAERSLEMLEGERTDLRVPGMTRFSLGSREVASVEKVGLTLVVTALHHGATTIEAWFADGSHLKWPVEVKARVRGATHEELVVGSIRMMLSKTREGYRVDQPRILEVTEMGSSLMVAGRSPGRAVLELDEGTTTKRYVFDVFPSYSRDELASLPRVDLGDGTIPSVLKLRVGTVAVFRVGKVETTVDSSWLQVQWSGDAVFVTALRPLEASLVLDFPDRPLRRIRVVADR